MLPCLYTQTAQGAGETSLAPYALFFPTNRKQASHERSEPTLIFKTSYLLKVLVRNTEPVGCSLPNFGTPRGTGQGLRSA